MRDTIYRDEAIEAVAEDLSSALNVSKDETRELAEHVLSALPSAENSNAKAQNSNQETQNSNGDLIYRADAIEAVCGVVIDEFDVSPTRGYEVAEKALSTLPSAEAAQGWIPCSERLPEKGDLVLVTVWNDVTIAWRNIYGGWESAEDMYEKGDVTAWMPLPDPYREDGE